MGKFCTSCGTPLNEGTKFCSRCGLAIIVSAKDGTTSSENLPPKDNLVSSTTKTIKSKVKKETKGYVGKVFSNAVPSYEIAGELALPLELTPFPTIADRQGIFAVLRIGLSGLISAFKRTLGDKKRLFVG